MIRYRRVTPHHRDQVNRAVVQRALGLGAPVPVEGYLPGLVLAVLFGLTMPPSGFSRRPGPAMPTSTVVTISGRPARCGGQGGCRDSARRTGCLACAFYSALVFFAVWKASSASPGVS
jgi:hypothetical protein